MKTVTVYTDGACSGNPGPGGWAAVLLYGQHQRELSGGEPSTTNNRMELTAIISALSALKEPCVVELYSDSKYVLDALEKGWAVRWRRNGWMRTKTDPALNPDLWETLLNLAQTHDLRCHWVRGHAGNAYNERCDALAVAESRKFLSESRIKEIEEKKKEVSGQLSTDDVIDQWLTITHVEMREKMYQGEKKLYPFVTFQEFPNRYYVARKMLERRIEAWRRTAGDEPDSRTLPKVNERIARKGGVLVYMQRKQGKTKDYIMTTFKSS